MEGDVGKAIINEIVDNPKDVLIILPKFVMLERAAAIISLSWIRGLVFIQVTSCVATTKLLKIKNLSKFFKHHFRGF